MLSIWACPLFTKALRSSILIWNRIREAKNLTGISPLQGSKWLIARSVRAMYSAWPILKLKEILRVHPRCANAHNCLGPTLGKWWNTEVSLINAARLRLAQFCIAWISGSPCLMDQRGLRVTHNAYFSLLTHTKKLLLVTFCDLTAETGVSFRTHERTEWNVGWTDRHGSWNSYLDISK